MSQAPPPLTFGSQPLYHASCLACGYWLEDPPDWPGACPRCGRKIAWYDFDPVVPDAAGPEVAMPEDVTCAFHPGKKAVETCAGTGSYICSLCAVPVGDQTYSADFLNRGGLQKIGRPQAFNHTLPRPDHTAGICMLFAVLMSCFIIASPIIWALAIWQTVKHARLRGTNPLYAKVTSGGTTAWLVVGLITTGLIACFFTFAVVIGALDDF